MAARRRTNHLPWTNISGASMRNRATAKSEAFAAWLPSAPLIPTPTCAALSMSTSLAPSPMASVTAAGSPSRTSRTTAAFWSGRARQTMEASAADSAASKTALRRRSTASLTRRSAAVGSVCGGACSLARALPPFNAAPGGAPSASRLLPLPRDLAVAPAPATPAMNLSSYWPARRPSRRLLSQQLLQQLQGPRGTEERNRAVVEPWRPRAGCCWCPCCWRDRCWCWWCWRSAWWPGRALALG
mmetsp:Transcript_10373/g.40353  ORF Transcript_10373/g.40353 Transcript_10373/m.40353 type:complete len:243 (+) Transcript_10373:407-1135(+)